MTSSWYNGFSPQQRDRVQAYLNRQWTTGALPRPALCIACLQDEGAIHGHLENYDLPDTFVALCITCHLVLHGRFRHAEAWQGYCDHVAAGWTAPALEQRRAFGVIQHGILRGRFEGGRWRTDVPRDGSGRTFLDTLTLDRIDLASSSA